MDIEAINALTYGLCVLTAECDGRDNGCIINTAFQVTSNPGRICIAVNKSSLTHDFIMRRGKFNISVLSEEADFDLVKRFGFQSGSDADKFLGYTYCQRSVNGVYYITKGTNAYISGYAQEKIDLDTHTLFIAAVVGAETLSNVPSATYDYYKSHIKPQPAFNAYKGKTVWRCKVCGYEYEGDTLPEDLICPVCKHPASDFEKIVTDQ